MYINASSAVLLTLQTLGLSDTDIYPAFLFGTLLYVVILFCNLLVLSTIAVSKKLHKPMFILLFNLPISDMVGATAFFPQLLFSMVTQNRQISHPACVIQAFVIHVYGTGNLLTLGAMAYDRYVAICCPLRYNAIMTPYKLFTIIFSLWFVNISVIMLLMLLLERYKICRTNIVDLFCNNPTLLKLACEDTRATNYFGVFTLIIFQSVPLSVILFTYAQILRTCIMTNQPEAWKKAIQTCGTHLVVYLILEISAVITLVSHRFESAPPLMRRALGVSVLVGPPFVDPLVYGLRSTELKQSILMLLKRNAGST
ncbi:putative gustatory receptor clone PTE01 [Plectropomus leopardus]|uniref:putative gustatory receptor clone PTE01 n=1 Tax=Plectropomus leopardus TaxID=160734 RepID=UPI001C4B4326|nr:putative gustatory receptor clone PTE01 [Plectropomus leopardus]